MDDCDKDLLRIKVEDSLRLVEYCGVPRYGTANDETHILTR